MNINEMSDEEKSVMLARLCKWRVKEGVNLVWVDDVDDTHLFTVTMYDGQKDLYPTLYAPENMPLARRVIQWSNKSGLLPAQSFVDQLAYTFAYAKDGQREALDMVLTLAIEPGMVTE